MPGTTTATLYVPVRGLSGIYHGAGISSTRNTRSLKTSLPALSVPIGYAMVNGEQVPVMIDDAYWYAFFRYQTEVVLGGFQAATLADVAASVRTDQVLQAATKAVTTALQQQAVTNAQALAAVREVAIASSLTGAAQIPVIQLVPVETNDGG